MDLQRLHPTSATIHRLCNSSRTQRLNHSIKLLRLYLKRSTTLRRQQRHLSKLLLSREIQTLQQTATRRLKGTTSKRKFLGRCRSYKKTRRWLCNRNSLCQTGSSGVVSCLQFPNLKPSGMFSSSILF
uniref:En/Spm-like transposon protein n=1 Tax=Arabidopsis thaliana TaxID=3702 RepID=Q9ZUQ0_ARATH|nr:En/Spm-like transposon protein [Arabidopsis thaliana]